jgi:hypothetical protein
MKKLPEQIDVNMKYEDVRFIFLQGSIFVLTLASFLRSFHSSNIFLNIKLWRMKKVDEPRLLSLLRGRGLVVFFLKEGKFVKYRYLLRSGCEKQDLKTAVLPPAGSAGNLLETTKKTTEIKSVTRNVSASAEIKINGTKNLIAKERGTGIVKGTETGARTTNEAVAARGIIIRDMMIMRRGSRQGIMRGKETGRKSIGRLHQSIIEKKIERREIGTGIGRKIRRERRRREKGRLLVAIGIMGSGLSRGREVIRCMRKEGRRRRRMLRESVQKRLLIFFAAVLRFDLNLLVYSEPSMTVKMIPLT